MILESRKKKQVVVQTFLTSLIDGKREAKKKLIKINRKKAEELLHFSSLKFNYLIEKNS